MPKIEADNYISGANGAVMLSLDDGDIYFHNRRVVAVVTRGVLFRPIELRGSITFARVRNAVSHAKASAVQQIPLKELKDLAVSVMAASVATAFDERMVEHIDG